MSETTIFVEKSIISLKFQENQNFPFLYKQRTTVVEIFEILGTDAVAGYGFQPTYLLVVAKNQEKSVNEKIKKEARVLTRISAKNLRNQEPPLPGIRAVVFKNHRFC